MVVETSYFTVQNVHAVKVRCLVLQCNETCWTTGYRLTMGMECCGMNGVVKGAEQWTGPSTLPCETCMC